MLLSMQVCVRSVLLISVEFSVHTVFVNIVFCPLCVLKQFSVRSMLLSGFLSVLCS